MEPIRLLSYEYLNPLGMRCRIFDETQQDNNMLVYTAVDYQRLEAELAECKAEYADACSENESLLSELKAVKSDLSECKAEIHRARTDSRYWDEFNTISAHDVVGNENAALRAEFARCREMLLRNTSTNLKLRTRCKRLEDYLFSMGAMQKPPCFCCGYNGQGYFNSEQHPCAKRHHNLIDPVKSKQALEVPK